ncbi:MAG: hypothetical protein R3A79_24705 [Nannocystaceae bacterium]
MEEKNDQQHRPTLGDFSSIICFRALVVGIEDTIGRQAAMVALKGAGRQRGKDLALSLGFGEKPVPLDEACAAMREALGADGTRLCWVDAIEQDGENYVMRLSETICSADEPEGSERELSFTLGAVHGALEVLTQKRFRAKQVGSVLRGDTHDVVRFVPR